MKPVQNRINVAIPHIDNLEIDAVTEVLRSGHYASGPRVAEFEKAFAQFVGVEHGVAVSNGTSALYLTLEAMGVGPGDEVLVPPMTFFATIAAVLYVGATPVFVDVDEDDLCMSPTHMHEVITPRTKAAIPVHFFGAVAKMDEIMAVAAEHGFKVIEDAAQAHGSTMNGRQAGSLADAGAFSFFATKHMTTGEGGIITTNDGELARHCKTLRSHGMSDRNTHEFLGYNNRMGEIGAAMGLVQLTKLDDLNRRRIEHSQYLMNALSSLSWGQFIVPQDAKRQHTYFWCPLYIDPDKSSGVEAFKSHLQANEIGFRHRYTEPLYHQPALKKAGHDYSDVHLANAERFSGNMIGLPNHPGLTREELDRVIAVVQDFS